MAKTVDNWWQIRSRANVCGYVISPSRKGIVRIRDMRTFSTCPDDPLGRKAWRLLIEGKC